MQGYTGRGNTDMRQNEKVPLFRQGNASFKLFVTEETGKESGIWTSTIKTQKKQRER